MNFSVIYVLTALILVSANVQGLENLMGTTVQKCLNCLCHARSGCWSRFNCARYSVSKDYWKTAGSPTVGSHQDAEKAYRACLANENCILNTIKSYTESFGHIDSNCDGVYDCKDRLAIHLFGKHSYNPKFGSTYASRFNDCASQVGVSAMLATEGSCVVPEVDAV